MRSFDGGDDFVRVRGPGAAERHGRCRQAGAYHQERARFRASRRRQSTRYVLALDAVGKRAEAKSLLQSELAKNENFEDAANANQLLQRR